MSEETRFMFRYRINSSRLSHSIILIILQARRPSVELIFSL